MRILVLTTFFMPIKGGSQLVLSELCRRLPAQEVVVYTAPVPGQEAYDESQKYDIIRSEALRPLTTVWPELSSAERKNTTQKNFWCKFVAKSFIIRFIVYMMIAVDVIRTARRLQVDIIICGQPFFEGLIALFYRWISGVPYVSYTYGEELAMLRKRFVMKKLLQLTLRNASTVFTISNFSMESLLSLGVNKNRICLQYPAINQDLFVMPTTSQSEMKSRLGISDDAPVIFTVARLTERKGIDTVIRVLPQVMKFFPNIIYLVGGSGADITRLKALVSENDLKKQVLFLGRIPDEEIVNYFHACDVYVMINRTIVETDETEGFGIVFLEANACGKPVVGGRAGGTADAVEDGVSGLLVDPLNVDEVANAIVRLLGNRDYAGQLAINGKKRVMEKFSWDKNSEKLQEVLNSTVLHKKHGKSQ